MEDPRTIPATARPGEGSPPHFNRTRDNLATGTHPVRWEAPAVTLTADDFFIEADGLTFTANVDDVEVTSDPPGGTGTTMKMTWTEHDRDMRLYLYLSSERDGTWIAEEITVHDGTTDPEWVHFNEPLFGAPIGSPAEEDVFERSDEGVVLHFEGLRLETSLEARGDDSADEAEPAVGPPVTDEFGTVEIEPIMPPPSTGSRRWACGPRSSPPTRSGGDRATLGPSAGARVVAFLTHWDPFSQRQVSRLVDWLETDELPSGVALVVVSTAAAADRDNWPPSDWLAREGWPTVVLLDDKASTMADGYGVMAFPSWVVVDADMSVATQAAAELSDQQFEEMLELAVAGP